MAKIKHTKTELKAQKDALARFQRFLPMLQLKKQQLQAEITGIRARIEGIEAKVAAAESSMEAWVALLSDETVAIPLVLDGIQLDQGNIAGLAIPVFRGIQTHRPETDLHNTPAWVDEAAEACEEILRWRAEVDVLRRQRTLIEEELRTTSQRVNLFEKVKIPECKENIRVIRIHIGDEQTSAVARGKIAKGRSRHAEPVEALEDVA
jgi:V/A-type H+-transporting ATPase subunit D